MNKLMKKIATAAFGVALAAGVLATISAKEANNVRAEEKDLVFDKVTASGDLDVGDVCFLYCPSNQLGVTGHSGSDATVSKNRHDWLMFNVTNVNDNGYALQHPTSKKYIYKNSSNKFTITSTNETLMKFNSNGYLSYNDGKSDRFLLANGTNYRCYTAVGTYLPFYVYKYDATKNVQATSILFDDEYVEVDEGSTFKIVSTLKGGAGFYEDSITWTSNNADVIAAPSVNVMEGDEATFTVGSVTGNTNVRLTATVKSPGTASAYMDITVVGVANTVEANDTTFTKYVGDVVDLTECVTTTGSANLTFEADNEQIVQIEGTTMTALATGTTTITATKGTESCTFDIVVNSAPVSVEFDLTSTDQVESASTTKLVYADNNNSVTFNKATASTNANNYYPGTPSQSYTSTRGYKNTEVVLDAGLGFLVKEVVFVCTSNGYASTLKGSTFSVGIATIDGDNNKVVHLNIADSKNFAQQVKIVLGNTVGFESIEILSVENTAPTVLIVSELPDTILVGDKGTLEIETKNVTNPVVAWSVNNTNVVSINNDGEYEAIASGTAVLTVTVTCDEGTASNEISMSVLAKLSISEAVDIGNELTANETTEYKVAIEGIISNLDGDNKGAGSERAIMIESADGEEEILVYGIFSSNVIRKYAIVGATVTFVGKIQKYVKDSNVTIELINPVLVDYTDDAEKFATKWYDALQTACNVGPSAVEAASWNQMGAEFANLSSNAQNKVKELASDGGYAEKWAEFVDRYTRIVNAGFDNVLDATIADASVLPIFGNDNNTVAIVAIVALVSISTLGVLVVLKKRKTVTK